MLQIILNGKRKETMADVIKKATNKFTKGLIMDFSPENTKNEVLTHALNATLLTFNGNELSLQNDMGNARVETAYLPAGYMPVGTCEYGGIIYIVSYNPLENKSLIGCFPSPERNLSNDELGISDVLLLKNRFLIFNKDAQGIETDPTGEIVNTTLYVLLKNDKLNPGDKFLICSDPEIYNERLSDLLVDRQDGNGFQPVPNPTVALNVVSIEESGKIVYLNSDIVKYDLDVSSEENKTYTYKYHILGEMASNEEGFNLETVDIDSYRNVLSSGYSVFKSKTSGKLAILAELIMIDSYSVTHNLIPKESDPNRFDLVIHTEITPEVTLNNYNTIPKLQYYYLQNSLGYVQAVNKSGSIENVPLYREDNTLNPSFTGLKLSDIYVVTDNSDDMNQSMNLSLYYSGEFGFPKSDTYHGRLTAFEGDLDQTTPSNIITKFIENKLHRLKKSQIQDNINYFINDLRAKFYKYNVSGEEKLEYKETTIEESYTYYVEEKVISYKNAQRNEYYNDPKIELFKLSTEPLQAFKEQIIDKTIEKFKEIEITTYRVAVAKDLDTINTYYTIENVGGSIKYTEVETKPSLEEINKGIYFVKETESTLVSIGTDVNPETVYGTIYYYPTSKDYILATEKDREIYFDFDKYPIDNKGEDEAYGCPITLFYKDSNTILREATETDKKQYLEGTIKLYYNSNYIIVNQLDGFSDELNQLFMVVPRDSFVAFKYFKPNKEDNYIKGYDRPESNLYPKNVAKDEPIELFVVSDFIPNNLDPNVDQVPYGDLKLATIKIPKVLSDNGIDLSFKYSYTLVPCMNYGKLLHLAISNTVDFSKLHAFEQSNFTTWKYRIDGDLLRLTFGAEIFDTYETNKVNGLILEFYDVWGFAGSIEISDKKAYSGKFTKVIPLNTLNTISKNKISGNTYVSEYNHNVNIIKNETGFTFNNKPIQYLDSITGWKYTDNTDLSSQDNDCGTLYSNMLYGVKAYLRRSTDLGYEYIKKKDLFLYTLPIYNDYYYSIDDFSTLENPSLDLMLTYKLLDKSSKIDYNEDTIVNGYLPQNKSEIDLYLSGFYNSDSLDVIKYYKYFGTSDLYLEIGLKKDYESINLSYDPNINKYFTCKLQLLSDDDASKTYSVISDDETLLDKKLILNYNNKEDINIDIDNSINTLGFLGNDESTSDTITKTNLLDVNFINNIGNNPIKIKYEFVVGYTASIINIRKTQVPATTVCALLHQNEDGEYNYSDFGIYEPQDNNYLSEKMLFNAGYYETERFGICTLLKNSSNIDVNSGSPIEQMLSIVTESLLPASSITAAGKLNSGNPLSYITPYIGKLTFCLPHAHAINNMDGVSIEYNSTQSPTSVGGYDYNIELFLRNPDNDPRMAASLNYLIPGNRGDCANRQGHYQSSPRYNMSLNTKNSIVRKTSFTSTLDWKIINDPFNGGKQVRVFTGFSGDLLAKYNKKLLTTMKSVYAYNPDYDSLLVNVGDISLQTHNPSFTSNLISTEAKLDFEQAEDGFKTFNDYIYIGSIKFSDYLTNLLKYSQTTVQTNDGININVPLVELTPNYTYCGKSETPYLVSTITYNTPVPLELEQELEFSASNNTVIKLEDGTNCYLKGVPNKKTLYGYNKAFNKLVELDVSNYEIDSEGNLTLKNVFDNEKKNFSYTLNNNDYYRLSTEGYSVYNGTFKGLTNTPISTTINLSFYKRVGTGYSYITPKRFKGSEYIYIIIPSSNNYNTKGFSIKLPMYSPPSSDYKYSTDLVQFKLEVTAGVTDDDIPTLVGVSLDLLDDYIDNNKKVVYRRSGGESPVTSDNPLPNNVHIQIEDNLTGNEIYKLKITEILWEVTRSTFLLATTNNIIKATKTTSYSGTYDHKYEVWSIYNNARIRGTSLTLNDLEYENNKDGHRLFVKDDLCLYDSTYGGKLYYRTFNKANGCDHHFSWEISTKNYNSLFLYTGPCFTVDNL